MRALTLTQPWAGLVASGIKLVENRSRKMAPRDLHGQQFAIHASLKLDESVYRRITNIAPELAPRGPYSLADDRWYRMSRQFGCVLAVATLDSTIVDEPDLGFHDLPAGQRRWFFGPIGYVLRDVIALRTPIACRGKQGFWTLSDDAEQRVRSQLAEAA